MGWFSSKRVELVTEDQALPGRTTALVVAERHLVLDTSMVPPFPDDAEVAYVAMGCFWGAERLFWQLEGVHTTAVGYAGGFTPNPTYEEVCSGRTGHAESVLVVFRPSVVDFASLLSVFFEEHDPTQVMRQGNDVGTQYRSALFATSPAQAEQAREVAALYEQRLADAGLGTVATEIAPASHFYYAEDYHQQYLAKNPTGYCGLAGTGVSCPTGVL